MPSSSALARYRRSMLEADMETAVAEAVGYRGGRLFHVRRSDVAPELTDLPDWLIIAPHLRTVALIEAKSQKRELTAGQGIVLDLLNECDRLMTGIVRPDPRPGEIGYSEFIRWITGEAA